MSNDAEAVVRHFLKLWSTADADAMADLFAEDGVYDNVPDKAPMVGREAVREWLKAVLIPVTRIDVEILNLSSNGEWVLNERIDDHIVGGEHLPVPVMNATRVVDGKIVMFRDYYCRQTCAELGFDMSALAS